MSRPTFCGFCNFRPRQNFEMPLLQEFLASIGKGKLHYITVVASNCRKVRKLNWRRTGARCDERLSEGKKRGKIRLQAGAAVS